jgi:LysM repeat protein
VGGYLQSAGVITEKVSIKEPSPYNANRLVIFKIGFNDEETSNIHIMPLAMRGVGVGSDARDNMVVMTVPLNAPSTYSPHKQLNAKDEERRFLYLFRFDNNNNLIDEQKIKSDLVNINNYQTLVAHKKTYVIGTGSVGNKGFISSFPGQNTDALSIAVIDENGKLSPFKTFSGKELEGKLETNNVKPIMKFIGGPNFYSVSELDNGNVFLFGKSDGWHHGVLLSSAGDLIKYYIFPHLDPTKNTIFTEQLHNTGKKIFILLADQPKELTNEKQTTTGSSTSTHYMGGGSALKTTTTTTTTTQLFEIFHLSNVYIIDGANGVIKKIQLDEEVKNFYTLSDVPAFFTNEGMYIPGRIKANKGKTVSLIKIDL